MKSYHIMQQNSSVPTYLNCLRLISLITAVCIVIGSLGFYSNHSLPLSITTDNDDQPQQLGSITTTWIMQTISDRRLISTLVAAQASIFCPLFMLLSQSTAVTTSMKKSYIEEEDENSEYKDNCSNSSFLEMACQFLMPLGLALSWIFSILFDMKTSEVMQYTSSSNSGVCLLQQRGDGCLLFEFIYGLKYVIVGLFALETLLVTCTFFSNKRIQLPLEDEHDIAVFINKDRGIFPFHYLLKNLQY
ncbi:hypothetical protein BDF20DRAFT_866167 [Mycotypha africana]|uniref:uncharacterized protein n=1 Tax=Mycotypha africana TaxID=64632 RepID=UPI0023014574|nr:uncharacterized protein BDF20DRAFT_866167 [Mycotypha africana]KAI8982307.1 hypothetical protein BDF20DRAFT_866167 [Mycotypha africana]